MPTQMSLEFNFVKENIWLTGIWQTGLEKGAGEGIFQYVNLPLVPGYQIS